MTVRLLGDGRHGTTAGYAYLADVQAVEDIAFDGAVAGSPNEVRR